MTDSMAASQPQAASSCAEPGTLTQPQASGAFVLVQRQFAAHLRHPHREAAPEGLEDRRLGIYRNLFYNNIEGFLRGGFPVMHKIMSKERWGEMVRDFFWRHASKTPYFTQIGQEFLDYLYHERRDPLDPPFMLELAYYEWVELDLQIKPEPENALIPVAGKDIFNDTVIVTPFLHALSFQYPVHEISPDFQPTEPPQTPTALIVYRQGEAVKFMRVNALTYRLVQLLQANNKHSAHELLLTLAGEVPQLSEQQIIDFGKPLFEQFMEKGIVLGAC